MCVSMNCKQIKSPEVKIIGIHLWSEESQASVDIGTLVLGKVKCALVILQKKFQRRELSQHSIALGGSHQNDSVGKQNHCFDPFCMASKTGWALKKKYVSLCFDISNLPVVPTQVPSLGGNITECFLTFEGKVFLTELESSTWKEIHLRIKLVYLLSSPCWFKNNCCYYNSYCLLLGKILDLIGKLLFISLSEFFLKPFQWFHTPLSNLDLRN